MRWRWLLVSVLALTASTAGIACTAGRGPEPPVSPQDSIRSGSMEEMPPTGTSGLGTPGGYEDAGLPLVRPDGAAPR